MSKDQRIKDLQERVFKSIGRITSLEAEIADFKKCNNCMTRQIDSLTNEPLSCNGMPDGTCGQTYRDSKELQLYKDLSEHARHDEGCSAAFGKYTCKCGFTVAKEAVDNFEKGKK